MSLLEKAILKRGLQSFEYLNGKKKSIQGDWKLPKTNI